MNYKIHTITFLLLLAVTNIALANLHTEKMKEIALNGRAIEQLLSANATDLSMLPPLSEVEPSEVRRAQRIREIGKSSLEHSNRHIFGFLHFSAVVSTYVGVKLLAEVEQGRLTTDEMIDVLRHVISSKEAIVGYFRFVGLYAIANRILKEGPQKVVPQLTEKTIRLAQLKALGRSFVRHHILLVSVVSTIDAGHHFAQRLAKRPWETEEEKNDNLSFRASILEAIKERPVDTLSTLFETLGNAVKELDAVDIIISQAAFVAGMMVASVVPGLGQSGFFQLAVGFIACDLAAKFLVEPIKKNIITPTQLAGCANRLHYVAEYIKTGHHLNSANYEDYMRKPTLDSLREAQLSFNKALEDDRKYKRESFEKSMKRLVLASTGKIDNDLTNRMNHLSTDAFVVPFIRLSKAKKFNRLDEALHWAEREYKEASQSYLNKLNYQCKTIRKTIGFETLYERIEETVQSIGDGSDGAYFSILEQVMKLGPSKEDPQMEEEMQAIATELKKYASLEYTLLLLERKEIESVMKEMQTFLESDQVHCHLARVTQTRIGHVERELREYAPTLLALNINKYADYASPGAVRAVNYLKQKYPGLRADVNRKFSSNQRHHIIDKTDAMFQELENLRILANKLKKELDGKLTDRAEEAANVENYDVRYGLLQQKKQEAEKIADSLKSARSERDKIIHATNYHCVELLKQGKLTEEYKPLLLHLSKVLPSAIDDGVLDFAKGLSKFPATTTSSYETALLNRTISSSAPIVASSTKDENLALEQAATLWSLWVISERDLRNYRKQYSKIRDEYNARVQELTPTSDQNIQAAPSFSDLSFMDS